MWDDPDSEDVGLEAAIIKKCVIAYSSSCPAPKMIGDKHDTEAADFIARWSGRRASHTRRRGMATEPGAYASEYADMSNAKIR